MLHLLTLTSYTALILGGDFFTGTVLAVTLTKLVLRFDGLSSEQAHSNTLRAQVFNYPFQLNVPS